MSLKYTLSLALTIILIFYAFDVLIQRHGRGENYLTAHMPRRLLQEMSGQKIIRGKFRTEQNGWATAIGSATLRQAAGSNYLRESSEFRQNNRTVVCEAVIGYSVAHDRFELLQVYSTSDSMLFLTGRWDAAESRLRFRPACQPDSLRPVSVQVDYYFYDHGLFKKITTAADKNILSELLYLPDLWTE